MSRIRNHILRLVFHLQKLFRVMSWLTDKLSITAAFAGLVLLAVKFGFHDEQTQNLVVQFLKDWLYILFGLYAFSLLIAMIEHKRISSPEIVTKTSVILLTSFLLFVNPAKIFAISDINAEILKKVILYFLVIVLVIRQIGKIILLKRKTNPLKIFIISFFLLISTGAVLLLLPGATYRGINFTEALFTSTSAVCVTGLTVVDTASTFTLFGKTVIMLLIQFGGLGIMTFTSFFVIMAGSNVSLHNYMAINEIVNHKQFGKIRRALFGVIVLTFAFELIGSALLFLFTEPNEFASLNEHIFFSVFHSISAFCNAGFSTAENGLMNFALIENYSFQSVIAALIIFGGLGYFVLTLGLEGIFDFFKKKKNRFSIHQSKTLSELNFRLVLQTTFILIVGGTIVFFTLEYHNTLEGLSVSEKAFTSFFSSVTARTAGFNTINYTHIQIPAAILMVFLMWIGGSPGSTAGGIKTTTIALAIRNIISLVRNQLYVTIGFKRISHLTIRKVNVIIVLSVITIFTGVFLLSVFEPDVSLQALLFEFTSALGTVGLSMDLTPTLSEPSKYVLICAMFIGRMGFLTILLAFVSQRNQSQFYYPETTIFIN